MKYQVGNVVKFKENGKKIKAVIASPRKGGEYIIEFIDNHAGWSKSADDEGLLTLYKSVGTGRYWFVGDLDIELYFEPKNEYERELVDAIRACENFNNENN